MDTGSPATMPTAAMQGEAAAFDGIGAAVFVSAEKDLVAKAGTDQDSWFVYGYLESSRGTLALLIHFLHVTVTTGRFFGAGDVFAARSENGEIPHGGKSLPTRRMYAVIGAVGSPHAQRQFYG